MYRIANHSLIIRLVICLVLKPQATRALPAEFTGTASSSFLSPIVQQILSHGSFTRANLTMEQKLEKLRGEMVVNNCQALIIPSEDEHQSEYVTEHDRRRAWITGFTGSAGVAVVTAKKAAMWTDNRYYIQAEKQLDSSYWSLMRQGERNTLSVSKYLGRELEKGENVCENAKFVSISNWKQLEADLRYVGLHLADVSQPDLIDTSWPGDERAPKPTSEIFVHSLDFAGTPFTKKIELVQQRMVDAGADVLVVTELAEISWLFNLRGSDIPYNPVFFAYAIISGQGSDHRLYVDPTNRNNFEQLTKTHLAGITVEPYSSIMPDIQLLSMQKRIIWISPSSSYAIYNAVTNKELLISDKLSPVRDLKAVKSHTELTRSRECQIRDSAARIRHMYQLETAINQGLRITEKSAAKLLRDIQAEDALFRSLSFASISAVGKNAAMVHYATSAGDDLELRKDEVYLLDAGAQYLDCTTDITRTHHFGEPSHEEVLDYTRVMQGVINLASMVFPDGVSPSALDVEARLPLWRAGLDYGHATGHGIDCFLSVHAAPYINSKSTDRIQSGMILSDEPGYYKEGHFGIRLENDIAAVEADSLFNSTQRNFLKFEPLSLVPFEPKLIDECLLTKAQMSYLNEYNALTRQKVWPVLDEHPQVQEFLWARTEPMDMVEINQRCHGHDEGSDLVQLKSVGRQKMNMVLVGISAVCIVFMVVAVWRANAYRKELKTTTDKHLSRF